MTQPQRFPWAAIIVWSVVIAAIAPAANAQIALIRSRATSYIFDVFAGATSAVDRLRIVESIDVASNTIVNEDYATSWGNDDGWAEADGSLALTETFALTSDQLVINLGRASDGQTQWIFGAGTAAVNLSNSSVVQFEVIEPVDYVLNAHLSNDAGGLYTGRVVFDDTSVFVPPILDSNTSFPTTVLTGTLPVGTYRLSGTMNGLAVATSANPGPTSGAGSYGMTLALSLPEPTSATTLAAGIVTLLSLARRRGGRASGPARSPSA